MRQMPEGYDIRIDCDTFLSSFTYDDGDGEHRIVGPWISAPGFRRSDAPRDSLCDLPYANDLVPQTAMRQKLCEIWEQYYLHAAAHVPFAVGKKQSPVPPLLVQYKGRFINATDISDMEDSEAGETEMSDQAQGLKAVCIMIIHLQKQFLAKSTKPKAKTNTMDNSPKKRKKAPGKERGDTSKGKWNMKGL